MAHLGIDIGGTQVALRAVLEDGGVRDSRFRWPDTRIVADDMDALADHIACAGWTEPVTSVGIAMPGAVDGTGHVVAWPCRPHWIGLDFDAQMGKLFSGSQVAHSDDGELAALAEAEAAGCADLVYLGVGTGVSGGLVVGGRSISADGRGACEVGHMIIDHYGQQCPCGRRGCVQSIASGPATLSRATRRRGGAVNFEELLGGLAQDQAWAVSAVDDGCKALAVAATNLIELLHPAKVVIGGCFAAAIDSYVDRVRTHATAYSRLSNTVSLIEPARLGGASALHGAVLLAQRD